MTAVRLHGQVGSWGKGLAVSLDDAAVAWLDELNCGRRLSAYAFMQGQQLGLRLSADERGYHVGNRGTRNAIRLGFVVGHGSLSLGFGIAVPRFGLTEAIFDVSVCGREASCLLPPRHLLPWPRTIDCLTLSDEEVLKEVEMRAASAAEAFRGQPQPKWRWEAPPQALVRRLDPKAYMKALLSGR